MVMLKSPIYCTKNIMYKKCKRDWLENMKRWYGKTMIKVVEMLDSDVILGLTENKIKYMRETYGKNIILKPEIESLSTLILIEIRQLWVIVSLFYIAMLFYNKLQGIGCIVILVLIISVILVINGDYKEVKNLVVIDNLNTNFARVIRCGKICKISCEEMVVGDIVFLDKGSNISADIRILECENLRVKEVAVTGEKYEVEKYSMKIEGEVIKLSEIKNIVFKSSVITGGSGLGIIIATGMTTQIGKIIKVLLDYKNDNRIFSKNLLGIANKLALITIIASIITLLFTIYKKFSIHDIINTLTYISMTFNLPILIILSFLFFKIIFAEFKKKGIYINNNSTIYVLSNISVIFTNKIGTISENKFNLREVYCDDILIYVRYHGLKIEGTIERIMSIALRCNDAKLRNEVKLHMGNSNSVENLAEYSILEFCNGQFPRNSELNSKQERIFKIPYNSEKKIKTVVNKLEDRYRANVTGVLDSLLDKCTHILINGVEKEIKDNDIKNIIKVHINMSNKAYNVIGYGYRNFNYEPSIDENIESNLVFVGLMGFENPIKEKAYKAMEVCKDSNIRPIIDDGDNKLASFAFGKLIGLIYKKDEILSGAEIDYMSEEEFDENIESVSIYSKITSKHKSKIVNSLNRRGCSVASIGDTLTDLEYLYNSNISISVGDECSNVVKKLSSLFLQENDFIEIIDLVKHSKKIINYISEFVLFLSVVGISEIVIILLSLIINSEIPITFIGILYLNYITVPCCGISILLQNRNNNNNLKNINNKYIKGVSIKNSIMILGIYILIFVFIVRFITVNFRDISLVIFTLYQIIFCVTLIYEKRIFKNKISYIFILLNLLCLSMLILYSGIFK